MAENMEVPEGSIPPNATNGDGISVLMLTAEWQVDAYGMAALTRSLVNDLWLTDPTGNAIKMVCAVMEADGRISTNDTGDAARHNVELRGAKIPRGSSTLPNIKWLDEDSANYYRHLVLQTSFDFIIGHIPYTANGALNLQDLCKELGQSPKVILVAHTLPRTPLAAVDMRSMNAWLRDADIVLSVGHGVEAEITPYIDDMDPADRPVHKLYIPQYSPELLTVIREQKELRGKQIITLMTTERKDLLISGTDSELAIAAAARAADNIIGLEGYDYARQIRMEMLILAPNKQERHLWERSFHEIKARQPTQYQNMTFNFHVLQDITELKRALKKTSVLLLPLNSGSPSFGIEALSAAAAGTPFLVSSNSGMASLLQYLGETKSVVHGAHQLNADQMLWGVRVTDQLSKPKEAYDNATAIRRRLIEDTIIASSHLDFIQIVTGRYFRYFQTSQYQGVTRFTRVAHQSLFT